MRPIRLTLTIELPPPGTEERRRLEHATVAELLGLAAAAPAAARPDPPARPGPAVRPHVEEEDEPPDVNAADDNAPRTGKQLAGWMSKQSRETVRQAQAIARDRGWGTYWSKLSDDQVAKLYRQLQPGEWGGRRAQ